MLFLSAFLLLVLVLFIFILFHINYGNKTDLYREGWNDIQINRVRNLFKIFKKIQFNKF